MAFLAFIPIPLYFIYALAKWGKQSFYPTAEWGAREQVQSESLQKGTLTLLTLLLSVNLYRVEIF